MRMPRFRFKFGLRGLMIFVLIVGGAMGWKARRVSFQKRSVAAIERLDGSVLYDWQYDGPNDTRKPAESLTGPIWLRTLLGDEYFQEIAKVELPFERIAPLQPYVEVLSNFVDGRSQAASAFLTPST